MPPDPEETRLIVMRNGGRGSMDDIRDADRNLERLKAAGEIPDDVQAETQFRETGVVITVRSMDQAAAREAARKIAEDPRGIGRFFYTTDTFREEWEV